MNTEKLHELLQKRKEKDTQAEGAMMDHDFKALCKHIRERQEIIQQIDAERRNGKRTMACDCTPSAYTK